MVEILNKEYLPFTKADLLSHFPKTKRGGIWEVNEKHLRYYSQSIEKYELYSDTKREGKSLKKLGEPFQIQKDERFWTIQCLLTWFNSESRSAVLKRLLIRTYGPVPPILDQNDWDRLIDGHLDLVFEASIPSPESFGKEWLWDNVSEVQFIPFILWAANGKKRTLEGATHVDAIIINEDTGFSIFIESKVLSDISYQISYDSRRNQIARNLDVMLERNPKLAPPLDKRDPEKTLFVLLTPRIFQNNPSRLYWYKYHDYKQNPDSLSKDLPHRTETDFPGLAKRIGWLTWEDFHEVNPRCCPWVGDD